MIKIGYTLLLIITSLEQLEFFFTENPNILNTFK